MSLWVYIICGDIRFKERSEIMEKKRSRLKNLQPYKYLAPAVIFLGIVFGIPLINTAVYAFADVSIMEGIQKWVGFKNFVFLTDPGFWATIKRTLIWVVFGVAGIFIYAMTVSLALNKPIPGRGFFRIVVIIPWLIPHAFAGTIWTWLLNSNSGFINTLLMKLGIIDEPISFFGESLAMATVIFIRIWKGSPFLIMSLLPAFQTIPEEVEEAAKIDGAGKIRYFINILIPMIKPVLVSGGIILTAWTITIFDIVYVLTGGGPSNATNILSITIYKSAFIENKLGVASAMSLATMLVLAVIGYFQMRAQNET